MMLALSRGANGELREERQPEAIKICGRDGKGRYGVIGCCIWIIG